MLKLQKVIYYALACQENSPFFMVFICPSMGYGSIHKLRDQKAEMFDLGLSKKLTNLTLARTSTITAMHQASLGSIPLLPNLIM